MRALLLLLLALHGAIHLAGVSRAATRADGLLWVAAAVVLITAAVLVLLRVEAWWLVAGIGLLLSQMLIVQAWGEAKYGTILNVVLLAAVVVGWADWRFQRQGDAIVRELFATVPAEPGAVVTEAEVDALPAPVQRWLRTSGVVGRPRARTARLLQRGEIRTSPEQGFMRAEARQYFTVDEPGFVWRVRVRMFGLPVAGRDQLIDGEGRMLIEALSLVPVVDGRGAEIDQGSALRFLGEIVWFPSAALAPYITWQPVDEHRARATMTVGDELSVSALFRFDDEGRMVEMTAERWMGSGEEARLTEWRVIATDWAVMDGVRIPVKGDVRWVLPGGEFTYYRWEILELEQDEPALYARRR